MELREKTKSFYVIVERAGKFIPYDVIPYLVSVYNERKPKDRPKTYEEFKKFVNDWSKYQFWARCEYEIILTSWPPKENEEGYKLDVYEQISMNIDVVTQILMNVLKK